MLARLIKKFFRKSRLSNCEQLFLVFFPQLFPSNWQQLFLALRRLCQQPVCHSRSQLALFLQQNFASSPRYSIFMQSHVRTTVRKRNSSLIKSIPLRVLRSWSWSSFCFKTFQLFNWYMIQRVIEQIVQQKFYSKDAMIYYRLKKLKIFSSKISFCENVNGSLILDWRLVTMQMWATNDFFGSPSTCKHRQIQIQIQHKQKYDPI